MFTDKSRASVFDEIHRQDNKLISHILSPDLFLQAALQCGLSIVCSPLNLVNLVWLALAAARDPRASFAALLVAPLQSLKDRESFSGTPLDSLLRARSSKRRRRRDNSSRHDPRIAPVDSVTAQAFAKARACMPAEFWVALFFLLGQRFEQLHRDVIRWGKFRLLAVDGTCVELPDYPGLRDHFGTAKNAGGTHGAQAQMVLVQFPLARLPYAYALEPMELGEVTLARQLLLGLRKLDLILLDAGYLSYGLLRQIHDQDAYFVLRLGRKLNTKLIKKLGEGDEVVDWAPKDSRGQWRKEGLPRQIRLRVLTYKVKGFRPLVLLTNVLDPQEVSKEEFWGLSISEEGEVLFKGAYNLRWEIETTYLELKVNQQMQGGLRSRTAEGIRYEAAGHVLHYLLMRWLMVEAAKQAGLSPLRLSFKGGLEEVEQMWQTARAQREEWVEGTLRGRLLERMAAHKVAERAGRTGPRTKKERRQEKGKADRRYRQRRRAKTQQQAKRAKHTKRPRPTKKASHSRWWGQGWNLSGPVPLPSYQG